MKHYRVSQWVDLARGLATETDAEAMRRHLDEGCAECRDLAFFCDSLAVVCREMNSRHIPAWVVRQAKEIIPEPEAKPSRRATWIPATLIYDSLLAPEPAGLRASWQVGWQALYRAGDCSLDLRVEPELSSSRAAVIGQIANHVSPETRMENIAVFLKAGKSVIAETRSNQFGEFQMEYEQRERLQLCVYLEDGSKCFRVPLKILASDKTKGAEGSGPKRRTTAPGLRGD